MSTGRRLAIGAAVVAGVTAYMAYLGAAASWQYYLTVDECLAGAATVRSDRIRVTGKVATGSLRIGADGRRADFSLQGSDAELPVALSGPVPNNLTEGAEVVVEGRLDAGGLLRAQKVLTRCASKYKSRKGGPSSEEGPGTGRGEGA